ncbi:MAG: FliG C-terminal domain-containing protein [Candidatus Latescibacterota bacterium]
MLALLAAGGGNAEDQGQVPPSFEDLRRLTDYEVQVLLREVGQKDLVVALKGASTQLTAGLLGNMSERVRAFITGEIEYLDNLSPEEIAVARRRILAQAARLGQAGAIAWPPGTARRADRPRRLSPAELASPELLAKLQQPFSSLSYEEIVELFAGLDEIARREGILSLEPLADIAEEGQLQAGIRLAVDGTEPDLIRDILETEDRWLLLQREIRCRMVIEGLVAIEAGDNPRIIEYKLLVFYHATDASTGTAGRVSNPALDEVVERLVGMGETARREGIRALAGALQEAGDDDLLRAGLLLIIDGTSPDLVIDLLAARMKSLLAAYRTQRQMIVEGLLSIQSGDNPEVLRARLRALYRGTRPDYALRF